MPPFQISFLDKDLNRHTAFPRSCMLIHYIEVGSYHFAWTSHNGVTQCKVINHSTFKTLLDLIPSHFRDGIETVQDKLCVSYTLPR